MMMPIRMGGWEDKIILHDRTSGQCQLPIGNSRALFALLAPFFFFFLAPADIDKRFLTPYKVGRSSFCLCFGGNEADLLFSNLNFRQNTLKMIASYQRVKN